MFYMSKTKVTKSEAPKKTKCPKEPIQIFYSVKEDIEMVVKASLDNHYYDRYGLLELAKSLRSKKDAKNIEEKVREALSLYKANYIGTGETEPLGAFHATLEDIAVVASRTENKGIRATFKIKVENYKYDSKDTWYEYRSIYPCECLADFISDLASELSDAVYDKVRSEAARFNEQLEKEKDGCKCKGCKCPKS